MICPTCGHQTFFDKLGIDGLRPITDEERTTMFAEYEAAMEEVVRELLEEARRKVWPQMQKEREGEHIGQGLMEFRMR